MAEKFLFRVAKKIPLPGLGVLLLPAEEAPELQKFDLYTALKLRLHYPTGEAETAIATVEEITSAQLPELRGLLLTQEGSTPVPVGAEIWWPGAEVSWEELL
ncbi:hypothetical protein K3G63_17535 [Hymenobacter sp. HSC-4F20]|uniref:hypothetical protein n=1 Tax=Hymenobacter sp. HSC-4F20 TaxID=2864135 RepID=UPI001C7357CA|nr:hypothetical protein [Hymenobacter sp. HSC-4F20]MBX0292254.1 hypothetical protein [Hymenobacter sp. HSC-4F20]